MDYKATFKSNTEVNLINAQGQVERTISATDIVINTGAKVRIPNIKGVDRATRLYDSTGIQNLATQPQQLVIVGGGYIALEFASLFANLGTHVSVLESSQTLIPNEDREIAELIIHDLENKGVEIHTDVETFEFIDSNDHTIVKTSQEDFVADAVLLATGRIQNTDLTLENTYIELEEHGAI